MLINEKSEWFKCLYKGFPGGSDQKESACNAGDLGLIPGLGRSPRGGHGNPLQYSCLENPREQTNLEGYVHEVAKGRTRLSDSAQHRVHNFSVSISSVQSLSRLQLFVTPWITAHQASLSITNTQSSLKLMSIESVVLSSYLFLCRPLLLLPPIPPSIRDFSNESTLRMRWPKYWSFSFSISPSNEHPGLISFRMDWLDLLAVQGILNSLLQHLSSKASILQGSSFFTVQHSHPYMTTGKTIA